MWPEFSDEDLRIALADFHGRVRTFGQVPEQAPEEVSQAIAS
jgi:hypothetical protein